MANSQSPIANSQKGFTLIEVVAALLIFTMGAGAAFALATQTISFGSSAKNRFVASYLAQEGAEVVRSIRDSNFLELRKTGSGSWTNGLTGCESSGAGCEASFADLSLVQISGSARRLYRDSQDVYSYDTAGTQTPFTRTLFVDEAGDEARVQVRVFWAEKGAERQVTHETVLYKWLNPS